MGDIHKNPLFVALERNKKVSSKPHSGNPLVRALVKGHAAKSHKPVKPQQKHVGAAKPSTNPLALALEHGRSVKRNPRAPISVKRRAARMRTVNHINKTRAKVAPKGVRSSKAARGSVKKMRAVGAPAKGRGKERVVKRTIGVTRVGVRAEDTTKGVRFKGASLLRFLRLTNLLPGVSEQDIVEIMSKYGVVVKVMMMEAISKKYGKSVTAEIFYLFEDSMPQAIAALDGRTADDRVLHVEIATAPVTVTDQKTWNAVVDEIKQVRQDRMRRSVMDISLFS